MKEKIVIAGFGGQGVLFAGKLLAHAAMLAGKHVTWVPSYGPEMRGGTAHCTVTIADQPVASPVGESFNSALVLNSPALDKFLPMVVAGGLLVANSSMINPRPVPKDINCRWVAARDVMERIGTVKGENLVMLGAYLDCSRILNLEIVETALESIMAAMDQRILKLNVAALREGYFAALPQYKADTICR